jgi:hypothetical protein
VEVRAKAWSMTLVGAIYISSLEVTLFALL